MKTYYIYKSSDFLQSLLHQYPNIKHYFLAMQPKDPFFTHQMEALFDNNDTINEYLYDKLHTRSDYNKDNNLHILKNQLTNEIITCKVNTYSIEIMASKKSNIFFDILYQLSKKYAIMDEQCIKQEV